MNSIITPDELKNILGISKDHLARMRMEGNGPAFFKLGDGRQASVRYRREDVERWIASRMRSNTSQAAVMNRSIDAI